MKRALFGVLGLALLAGLAIAVPPETKQPGRWRFASGLFVGAGEATADRQGARLGGAATVDFTSASVGVQFSSAITKTGAAVGDICTVSAPAAASALKAKYSCVVTATNEVKVLFEPINHTRGSVALTSASPSTATAEVPVLSTCGCDPVGTSAAIAAAGCATSLADDLDGGVGTLTLTGPDTVTTTVVYDCAAPVDPASGSYSFELTRNGT